MAHLFLSKNFAREEIRALKMADISKQEPETASKIPGITISLRSKLVREWSLAVLKNRDNLKHECSRSGRQLTRASNDHFLTYT